MSVDSPAAGRTVRVDLGARSYDVLIGPGLAARAETLISGRLGARRVGIVTDRSVAALHLASLERQFTSAGRHAGTVVIEPGESSKRFDVLAGVCEQLLDMGLERGDLVLALGGGVIGDLAGFAAAILRRGVRFVQMPTTLLAQVDSSVGGKTGINTAQGKNLVGAFHQPSLVLADTGLLATLPERHMRAGYAEVVKHALLGDAAYFDWLEDHALEVFRHDAAAVCHAVARSVEMKAAIVSRDETETGERMLLNLGHTFGHALEAFAGYSDRLLHGEAVAIGTCLAARFSEQMQLCPPQTGARVAGHMRRVGLPSRIRDMPGPPPAVETLLQLMAQDKKVKDGRLTLILLDRIGTAVRSQAFDAGAIRAFLTERLSDQD